MVSTLGKPASAKFTPIICPNPHSSQIQSEISPFVPASSGRSLRHKGLIRLNPISIMFRRRPGRLNACEPMSARADGMLAGREASEVLQAALQKLSPELRETVILRDLEELEYREIATRLGCTEGSARTRVHRGLARLASLMEVSA